MEHDVHARRLLADERRARLAADYGGGPRTTRLAPRLASALARVPRRRRRRRLVSALDR